MKGIINIYNERKEIIKKRLNDFSKISRDDIFYELCFCILTPQSSAKMADKCIQELKKRDFKNTEYLNPEKLITNIINNKNDDN